MTLRLLARIYEVFFLDYIPVHVAQNVEVHLSQTILRGFCSRERMIICN